MLADTVIHGFNILCRTHFEHVAGLRDPLLGQTAQFSVMKNQKFFMTTGLIGLLSAHNCKKVNYYDSLFSCLINDFVKQQICALLQADEDC